MSSFKEIPAYARLPLPVVGAEACELILADGRRVLDLYGGHCVNTLGAGDPQLGQRLGEQWQTLSFVTNMLDHAPRADFEQAFQANLPAGDWAYFASNSGAEANENALKLALAVTKRSRVLVYERGFHGRTAAAAHASTVPTHYPQGPFEVVRVPFGDLQASEEQMDERTAAVLIEPIPSLAGVLDPPPGFLAGLRQACDACGSLLIFDEVQTGNGRLGTPWASQYFDVRPDAFTTAKGAAAGLPIGLTIADAKWVEFLPAGLLGSTFGGGPMVLAAAAEVSRRVASPGFLEQVQRCSAALKAATEHGPMASVRGAGLLLGLVVDGVPARTLRDALLQHDILTGLSNDPQVLRLTPPLTLPESAATRLAEAFDQLLVTP